MAPELLLQGYGSRNSREPIAQGKKYPNPPNKQQLRTEIFVINWLETLHNCVIYRKQIWSALARIKETLALISACVQGKRSQPGLANVILFF